LEVIIKILLLNLKIKVDSMYINIDQITSKLKKYFIMKNN